MAKQFNQENVIKTLRNHFPLSWKNRAKELNKLDNPDTYTGEQLRSYCRLDENEDWYAEFKRIKGSHKTLSQYDMHKNTDLSFTNKIKTKIIQGETITEDVILDVAGMDKDEWKVDDHVKFNEWPTPMDGEAFYNFQFRVSFSKRPITEMRPERIIELLKDIKPRTVEYELGNTVLDDYLYIPLADMHFGFNSLEDYEYLLENIIKKIRRGYKKILISMHGDYNHTDNFLGTTEKGTKVDDIDFEKGINDGYTFLIEILEKSLVYSPEVELVYLPGNHAPSIDYMVANAIKRWYPQIKVDDSKEEYKCSWLGDVAIFGHHGDKKKNLTGLYEVITARYKREHGRANASYLFTGHFHNEKSESKGGIMWYQVKSPSKDSSYEKTYGFNISESGLQMFVFDNYGRTDILHARVKEGIYL